LPVPPLPVTTCSRTGEGGALTCPSVGAQRPACASVPDMTESARRKWEYATIPLLIHNTKAILDSWGVDGWELVTVLPGPGGSDQLVAYLKRPA
jgi:hypothetical protein